MELSRLPGDRYVQGSVPACLAVCLPCWPLGCKHTQASGVLTALTSGDLVLVIALPLLGVVRAVWCWLTPSCPQPLFQAHPSPSDPFLIPCWSLPSGWLTSCHTEAVSLCTLPLLLGLCGGSGPSLFQIPSPEKLVQGPGVSWPGCSLGSPTCWEAWTKSPTPVSECTRGCRGNANTHVHPGRWCGAHLIRCIVQNREYK